MEQCQTLREYAQYVAKVRKYAKNMELNEAVELAVEESIREGILSEFLRRNRAEVIAVSIFEYDKEEEEKKLRKAEYEAGFDRGIIEGEQRKAKETAFALMKMGMTEETIAEALKIEESLVRQWNQEEHK